MRPGSDLPPEFCSSSRHCANALVGSCCFARSSSYCPCYCRRSFVLLPGLVIPVRLFCPRSTAPLNRYVVRLYSSSPVLIGYVARPCSAENRRLQPMSTGGKVNGVPTADGQRTARICCLPVPAAWRPH